MSEQLVQKIEFPPESAAKLAKQALGMIDFDRLRQEVARQVLDAIPRPKDGQNLVLTEALRADVIDAVSRLIPAGRDGEAGRDGQDGQDGVNYELTRADQEEIAKIASGNIKVPTALEILQTASDVFVSESMLRQSVARLEGMITRARNAQKPIQAGISGQDIVEELNKIFGSGWQAGRDFQAWGTFNGEGVPALYCGRNVSSITDLGGQGHYRANFINPIVDGNGNPVSDYGILPSAARKTAGAARFISAAFPTSTSVELFVYLPNITPDDEDWITFAVLRDC